MGSGRTLLIMAAGMGSRYGGMKQIDHVDDDGHKILDFSIYDAIKAGFDKVVFVIKRENLDVFKSEVGSETEKSIRVEYAFQELTDIPSGCSVPEGRVKPWGTAHAVYAARDVVAEPFAVINADDFYGRDAFIQAGAFLEKAAGPDPSGMQHYAMIGYELRNTLTENGTVSRGICSVGDDGLLREVVERTKIRRASGDAEYTEDEGASWNPLSGEAATSMNFWCFTPSFMEETGKYLEYFMKEEMPKNPLKSECYLPSVISHLLKEGICDVNVLRTSAVWHGVTYKEDKPGLVKAIEDMKEAGIYPRGKVWQTS